MGGFFGVASHQDCVFDLFYGTDYHSHLGTRRAGLAVYSSGKGFDRAIHNIESSYFRPKFEGDIQTMSGHLGIGCISDYESQPLVIRSHLGAFAISTVGKINNIDEILEHLFANGHQHFMEMSPGADPRVHDDPSPYKGRNLCGPRPLRAASGGNRKKRRRLLRRL